MKESGFRALRVDQLEGACKLAALDGRHRQEQNSNMTKNDDPTGRRTRSFWHSVPMDDAWKQVTLAGQEQQNFKLQPHCRNCQHRGSIMTPSEVAAWARVSMSTPVIALAARLVCSKCGFPAGYFHGHNPMVKPHL